VLTLRNGAIPATGSAYAYRCFEKVVDDDVSAALVVVRELHTCTQQLLQHAHSSCTCVVLVAPVLWAATPMLGSPAAGPALAAAACLPSPAPPACAHCCWPAAAD
jgi:hypothetical protein